MIRSPLAQANSVGAWTFSASLAKAPGNRGRSKADLAAALLKVERICDALADGEFDDLAIGQNDAEALAIEAIRRARGRT